MVQRAQDSFEVTLHREKCTRKRAGRFQGRLTSWRGDPALTAIKTFEAGRASLGQAARISGLSKRTFMEFLGRFGVPVFVPIEVPKAAEHAFAGVT